ncbi:WG repeat-containing protein [Janthinobacterium sp. 17J80-10]|uniref:WG repeat-containing protein n=1 Tax=Janthinobacterium sp. 17J80-10 TaxID=2497863 RepID=UPI00100535A2|nr:WG repeat-containing protein [Janthinobacterium sp. 17J80-10]QAU32857.1 WG repeat-containing protein [Janthinobacterium sp. 17J80-10]
MENSTATASQDTAPAQELLLEVGHSLLKGETWEGVFNHPGRAWHSLYIAYTHDKLGTPDQVEGVFFAENEAEALAEQVARDYAGNQPWQRPFYKFKVANWPLGALAIRNARDSFHRGVVRQVVGLIKQALQRHGKLPRSAAAVTVGAGSAATLPAYIDASGRRIVLWEDCSDAATAEDSVVFATCGKTRLCGLMNGCGEILVPPAFQDVAPLRQGLAVAVKQGKYGYIDADGNVAVPFMYEDAADCCQDLLLVKSDGLWGALDRDGQEVIAPRFAALEHDVGNEALRAVLDGRHGYLSLSGELMAGYSEQPLLLAEQAFAGERAVFIARETPPEADTGAPRQILVDALGRPCGDQHFAAITYGAHDDGLLPACAGDAQGMRHGYIGLHGETVIGFRFAAAESFSEGLAAAADMAAPACYGYIDRRGNWAIAPRFDYAGTFHHGLAVASSGAPAPGWRERLHALIRNWRPAPAKDAPLRRYGYIDRRGHYVIAPRYLEARAFSEGLAPVRTERGWCYIDTCGVPVTPDYYQEAGPFKRGVARIGRRFDGPMRFGLVDSGGREIIPPRFERLSYPQRGMVTARDEFGLWGCFTLYGNIVAPFIYRQAHDLQVALAARGRTQVT